MSPIARLGGLRRIVCALALPAFPLALLVSALVAPTESIENADQLRAAAAHGSSWQAAALAELLMAAILPFAVAGIVHIVRRRGAALANAGAVCGVLGTVGLAVIGARHLFVYGLASIDVGTATQVIDRVDDGAGTIALPLMFGGPLALILLAAATVRARLAPAWVAAGAVLFFVVDMFPIPEAEVVQALVGLVTFGAIAVRLLRVGDEPGAAPAPARARFEPAATA